MPRLMPLGKGLQRRDRQPEVMDQPGLDPGEHARALAGLRLINGISGLAGSLLAPIEAQHLLTLAIMGAPARLCPCPA